MKTYGFGVIGCGFISEFHIKSILEIENAKLIGVASRSKERAESVAKKANCIATTDYNELLKHPEIDFICVTTTSGSHGKIGLDALEHGKHLIVEKPMAMTTREAYQMISEAEDNNLILSVISQRRFEAQHKIVKNILSKNLLGKLISIDVSCPFYRTQEYYDSSEWRGTLKEDGGAFMNQGIHSIDLMLWLMGHVRTVYGKAVTQTHDMEAEDLGVGIVTFENNAIGTILATTSFQPGFPPTIHIYGEKGTIKLEGMEIVHWSVKDIPKPILEDTNFDGGGVADPTQISYKYHKEQIIDVIEALAHDKTPCVTGSQGKDAVQLIEAIYQSSKTGKEVVI